MTTSFDLSGAGEAIVRVDGVLNVDANGASKVTYFGNPTQGKIETSAALSIQSGI